MTADMSNYPGTGLAVLFGSSDDLAAALTGAGLPDWIEKNVGGALGGLSPATRAAAAREITATVASLLNVNPVDVLVDGWREYKKITDAARGTLAATGSTELLALATHQISETLNPYVTVLVDDYRIATLQLSISIVCDVQAMLARISAGRLVAVESGRCYVTAALAIADAEITSRTTRFDLPGAVSLGRGLRLLPAEEYPAAGHSNPGASTTRPVPATPAT
jgi:hypothetical protein